LAAVTRHCDCHAGVRQRRQVDRHTLPARLERASGPSPWEWW
jgi:hypothetical protein